MRLQEFIHSLEQGQLAKWVGALVALALFAGGYTIFVIVKFYGLTDANGMDQAQVSREIARGNGFSTKDFRPLAVAQFQQNKGVFPIDKTPETYHAPLNPWVNSIPLRLTKKSWTMKVTELVYESDRMVATVCTLFMLLGLVVNYLTFRRIFDEKISNLTIILVMFCNQLWLFILTGLPQMLMFFLFSVCAHLLFRAIEAHRKQSGTTAWLAAAGFCFGLLALTHALTIWILAGALVFSVIYFKPRFVGAGVMAAVFLLVWSPWLVRNYNVCGNVFGISHYSLIGEIAGSEQSRMRSQDLSLSGLSVGGVREKLQSGSVDLSSRLYLILGQNCVAPVFLVALLYIFKRREASDFRWLIFVMWLFAYIGTCLAGFSDANNVFILFVPIFSLYGFAYVMMLWARLDLVLPFFRYTFIALIFAISGLPLFGSVMRQMHPKYQVNWPPYCPPFIALINSWTTENEVIATDMPWAVAWYADRKGLEIPVSMSDFLNYYDWSEFTGNLVGLYLTPITGDKALISEVLKGEDRDWAQLILRGPRTKDFPFHTAVPLGIDNDCVFYCESDRWSQKTD